MKYLNVSFCSRFFLTKDLACIGVTVEFFKGDIRVFLKCRCKDVRSGDGKQKMRRKTQEISDQITYEQLKKKRDKKKTILLIDYICLGYV